MNDLSFENGLDAVLSLLIVSLNGVLAVVAIGAIVSLLGI